MKSVLREYGVIIGLIVISVSGYLLFSQNKQDILAYSMDVLGEKLVSLIDDPESKMRVAAAFDRFEGQVLSKEVSPQQVQYVAANVLNLVNSGARLSPEEAEYVLELKAPGPPGGPTDVAPGTLPQPHSVTFDADLTRLGENLEAIFQFSDAVGHQDSTSKRSIRFETNMDGLFVVVDSMLENEYIALTSQPLKETLDQRKLIRWEKEVSQSIQEKERWFKSEEARLAELGRFEERTELNKRVESLTLVRRLQSLGVEAGIDSTAISREVELILAEALAEVGAELKAGLQKAANTTIVIHSDSIARRGQ